jgi:type IV pilus assembly protein PilM
MSESGPVVNGLLVAAVKDAILGNVKSTELAGLTTVDVDLIPFALARVLLSRAKTTGSVALIEIGANTTSVVIAADGVPQFVRIIPTGGADLTQALHSELEIDFGEAEQLKASIGLAKQVSTVEEHRAVEVIYRVTSELLTSLRNTVGYFVNTHPAMPVREIVITGGGAHLPGLTEALAEMTRLPVAFGDPFHTISLSRSLNAEVLRRSRSRLAVALGLALGSAA